MGKIDKQDRDYIKQELAEQAEDSHYSDGASNMPAERETSPEKMHKQFYNKKGSKR